MVKSNEIIDLEKWYFQYNKWIFRLQSNKNYQIRVYDVRMMLDSFFSYLYLVFGLLKLVTSSEINPFKQKQCQLFLNFLVIQAKLIQYKGEFHWTEYNLTQLGKYNEFNSPFFLFTKNESDNSNDMKRYSRPKIWANH